MKLKKPVCAISKNKSITKAVFEVLSNIELPDLNGKKILLKPNIGRQVEKKNTGINTSPTVVNAVYRYLKSRFKAEFYLGDSPILGVKTKDAFIASGYKFLMKQKDINFIDLDGVKPVTVPIKGGRIIKKIKLTGYINEFDYIISIPVLKMHMHTGASLSFKNMKGVIYKREKVKLHQLHVPEEIKGEDKELDIAIADLAHAIEPDLAVIDGYYAQEGLGPAAGDRKKMNTVIASTDYLAADVVALAIVKQDIGHVPHLRLISDQKSGVSSIKDINIVPPDIRPFQVKFEPPPTDLKIENQHINLIDVDTCSACLSSVFLFIKNNHSLIETYFNHYGQLNLAVGKGVNQVPDDAFIVGNCAIAQKVCGTQVKGCPPSQTILKEIIEEMICNYTAECSRKE